jgi:hypothetical protein
LTCHPNEDGPSLSLAPRPSRSLDSAHEKSERVLAAGIAAVATAGSGTRGIPLEDEGDGGGAADGERLRRA